MSDNPKQLNRIPFESINEKDAVSSWSFPTMDQKKTKIVFTARKDKNKGEKNDRSNETIEDYKNPVKPKPITAVELQKITEEARQEGLAQGHSEGFARGLQEGSDKGHKEGANKAYKDTKAVLDSHKQLLNQLMEDLADPFHQQQNELERIVVDLAVKMSEKIVARQIELVPEIVVNTIKKALTALPAGSNNINVFVNPEDAEIINDYIPQTNRNWQVKIDESLQSGGCRIETLESLVDYSVEERINQYLHQVSESTELSAEALEPVQDYSIEESTTGDENSAEKIETFGAQTEDSEEVTSEISADTEKPIETEQSTDTEPKLDEDVRVKKSDEDEDSSTF